MRQTARTARIFDDTDGYHISDDSLDYLDTGGPAYRTRREAIAALRFRVADGDSDYTHLLTPSGQRVRIGQ